MKAFSHCTNLKEIVLPNSVMFLGGGAFDDCKNLERIKIPSSLVKIEDYMYKFFTGCDNLSEIVVENSNPIYDSRNNSNAIIITKTNELIVGSSKTIIPDTVTTIGDGAFQFRLGLKKIQIPASVKKLSDSAFRCCRDLEEVSLSEGLCEIGKEIFSNCKNLHKITILSRIYFKYPIFENCRNVKTLVLGPGIKNFCDNFFDSFDDSLENIYVPYKKVDYYKRRIPGKLHGIIKELPK